MDEEKIRETCTRVSERVKEQLAKGDVEGALRLMPALEREYWGMHKSQAVVMVDAVIPFITDKFHENQKRLAGEIKTAIENRDIKEAVRLIDLKTEKHMLLHDIYVDLYADFFGYIYDTLGQQAFLDCLRKWGEVTKKWFEKRADLSRDEKIEMMATSWREHISKISIIQEKDKSRVILQPCGSGGRRLDREKAGVSGRKGFSRKMREEFPLCIGPRKNIPIYCMHCPYLFETLSREWAGQPLRVMNPPDKAGDPCIIEVHD